MGLGYRWVCAVLELSPCQCQQYTNAEATWAYAGCNFVAFKQLEAAEKANYLAEHGHCNQPGPAHKGGYSPHPQLAPTLLLLALTLTPLYMLQRCAPLTCLHTQAALLVLPPSRCAQ